MGMNSHKLPPSSVGVMFSFLVQTTTAAQYSKSEAMPDLAYSGHQAGGVTSFLLLAIRCAKITFLSKYLSTF